MRKVLSFANKTLDSFRSFPEYTQLDSSLNEAGAASIKYSHDWNETCGHSMKEFVEKQPPTISEPLSEIQKQEAARFSILQSNSENFRNLKTNLSAIQSSHATIVQKKKTLKDLNQASQKLAKSKVNAEIKLQKLDIKNPSSVEVNKAKTELEMAKQKKEAADKQYEDFKEKFQQDNKEYKKEIFTTIFNLLIDFSSKLIESCDNQMPIATELAKQGSAIANADCSDPDVAKLQEELDNLRASEKTTE